MSYMSLRWYFGCFEKGNGNTFIVFTCQMKYTKSHDMTRYVWTQEEAERFLNIIEILKNYLNFTFETAEECNCISRPSNKTEAEGLPEAVANITLVIMEKNLSNRAI